MIAGANIIIERANVASINRAGGLTPLAGDLAGGEHYDNF